MNRPRLLHKHVNLDLSQYCGSPYQRVDTPGLVASSWCNEYLVRLLFQSLGSWAWECWFPHFVERSDDSLWLCFLDTKEEKQSYLWVLWRTRWVIHGLFFVVVRRFNTDLSLSTKRMNWLIFTEQCFGWTRVFTTGSRWRLGKNDSLCLLQESW